MFLKVCSRLRIKIHFRLRISVHFLIPTQITQQDVDWNKSVFLSIPSMRVFFLSCWFTFFDCLKFLFPAFVWGMVDFCRVFCLLLNFPIFWFFKFVSFGGLLRLFGFGFMEG